MNALCVICSDLLTQPDDIFYTRCGHVFHFKCLTQWLGRSKTCPQCREKVTQSRIHKLYLTVSSNESNVGNDSFTEDRVASLMFQIRLKEKDINYYMSKNATMEKQNAGLRKEVRKLESEINEKNSVIHALKEQTKYFKAETSGYNNAKKEIMQLKKKIENLRNIQMLLDAPAGDVKDIVGRDRDPATLLTYISVMKNEIVTNLSKIKHLKIKVKNLQDEHAKLTMRSDIPQQNYSSGRRLEEEFAYCESEKMALQVRVNELEKMLGITDTSTEMIPDTSHKSNSRKRSHTVSPMDIRKKEYIIPKINREKGDTSSVVTESAENNSLQDDSMLSQAVSDTSIAIKKSRLSRTHEETNDKSNADNSTENVLLKGKHADTSINMCSKTSKERDVRVKREKSSKAKYHKKDIIDLT